MGEIIGAFSEKIYGRSGVRLWACVQLPDMPIRSTGQNLLQENRRLSLAGIRRRMRFVTGK